jgi:hypothetical protein
MKRVVFGVCLDGSDYERRCVPRGFLSHNREETVFLFAGLHRVPLTEGALRGLGGIVSVGFFAGYCQK